MIKEIVELWNKKYTTNQIAKELGITRGAVAGHIFRARREGMNVRERPAVIIKKEKPTTVRFDNEIIRLKIDSCRYIMNDDMTKPIFCGDTISRRAYCETHAKLCYIVSERKR
jgi:hypothetical protein